MIMAAASFAVTLSKEGISTNGDMVFVVDEEMETEMEMKMKIEMVTACLYRRCLIQ